MENIYARWLEIGTRIGLALLLATFAVYAFAVLEPLVAHHQVVGLWHLPAPSYVEATGAPTGWGWLGFLHMGDYLNFLGVVLLAMITLVCYGRIVPALLKEGARLQAGIAALQILVLLAAIFY